MDKKTTIFALAVLVLSVVSAASGVSAFRLGNYEFGFGGIETAEEAIPAQAQTQARVQERLSQEEIIDAINDANQDKRMNLYLKSGFAGDTFCLETEEREAYLLVEDDGTFKFLSEKPAECYRVRSSEAVAYELMEKYNAGEYITAKYIRENVDLPWRLRARIAWLSVIS